MSFLFIYPRKRRAPLARAARTAAPTRRPAVRRSAALDREPSRFLREPQGTMRARSYGSFVRPFGGF